MREHSTKPQKTSSRNDWLEPVRWRNGALEAVDCTSLPGRLRYIRLGTLDQVCNAIRTMKVRGAPLIGVVGAYGLVLASRKIHTKDRDEARRRLRKSADTLIATRPTGVNLRWAVERVYSASSKISSTASLETRLLEEANSILDEELRAAHSIGIFGATLIDEDDTVLTHCNAGALATA